LFFGLSVTLYLGLKRDNPNELPSTFIGKQAPEFKLSKLQEKEKPTQKDLNTKKIKLVNFWASWCAPCRVEHKYLHLIQESGHIVLGVNYKDKPQKAINFLDELGDPYSKVGADLSGRTAINWGLYGVPETFIIDENGIILFRNAGPITSNIYINKILPLLKD
jgi:cytochrome c biogenesis protein CcmG/thiol:disulfide interchange protein DsbE